MRIAQGVAATFRKVSHAMGSKSKSKAATFSPITQVLNANLSNSTFGFVPAVGWKGKSPASSSRRVLLEPDLDLLSGFAFLSFASLDELESHIENNETSSTAISVNVGQKRKVKDSDGTRGENSGFYVPPSKKKPATGKKKPTTKKASPLTTDAVVTPRSKTDKVPSVGAFLEDRELSQSIPVNVSGTGSERNDLSSNVFSEISLLCSETVDLGDEEDLREETFKAPPKAVTNKDVGDGLADLSAAANECKVATEGIGTSCDSTPKKKKKKKRKNEHCDQTSQTKFRIKKRKKLESKVQDSEGTSKAKSEKLGNDECPDLPLQDVENLQFEGSNGEDGKETQAKSSLSRPKMERSWSARTIAWPTKGGSLKNKLNTSEPPNQTKETVENNSLDGVTPISSDQEVDVGDETTSVSVLSDLSDHSSEADTCFDTSGCFLLNNKIEKVEKEDLEDGKEILDVDVETVGKETRKNFLVVSGVEAGHFSYHPGMTKDGTIDTSIQALPNEIDIFLQCAKMQEGEVIKIINPDDFEDLHSNLSQKNGRDPVTVKATRSATERKRRHHLGDLFNDMKLEVFTDLVDADLYFSKQAILSKGISTIEELEEESKKLRNTEEKLRQNNEVLKEKRNMLMFGKTSINVDSAKVEAIFKHLNISMEEDDVSKPEENLNSNQEVALDAASESKVIGTVEPCVKGRPRAKNTLLSPWVSSNKPALKNQDELQSVTAPAKKTFTGTLLETSKETLGTVTSSSQTLSSESSNVSCGVQTQEVTKDPSKLFTLQNPPIPQILSSDNGSAKSKPTPESTSQEDPKANLVKILPKPGIPILQLHPTQQKMIMDTLGQVKQPSSDKIICNLSRLSTQQNPSSSSNIRIIRSGPLMKSLESKNVMHITITGTNDALKNADGASFNTTSASTLTSNQQVSTASRTRVPNFVTVGIAKIPEAPGISTTPTSQKHPENTILVSKIPLKPTPTAKVIIGGKQFDVLTSTSSTESRQSINQTTSDIALRALASLNQLQANKAPQGGTVPKPVGLTINPVAGILSGLKNVVMKVVPRQPEACSTTSGLPTLPKATTTTTFKSSQVTMTSSQENHPATTKCPIISVIPVISIPGSSPLNTSFTTSAHNPLPSPGIRTNADTSTPLIKTCLDPFNLVPKQLTAAGPLASSPPVSSSLVSTPIVSSASAATLGASLPCTNLDLGTTEIKNQVDDLIRSAQSSPKISDDIFKEEPSPSSTVLTQEMLQIAGIDQNPDVPLAKLPEVIENLVDLDKTTDDENSPEPSCDTGKGKPERSAVCSVSSPSYDSGIQVDKATISTQSSTVGVKKATSPLKVEIKDFRKGISLSDFDR